MAQRITITNLRNSVKWANRMAGYPDDGMFYDEAEGRYLCVPGAFALDAAYGGYRLVRYASEGGGEWVATGRDTARNTYNAIHSYMQGWRDHEAQGEK